MTRKPTPIAGSPSRMAMAVDGVIARSEPVATELEAPLRMTMTLDEPRPMRRARGTDLPVIDHSDEDLG